MLVFTHRRNINYTLREIQWKENGIKGNPIKKNLNENYYLGCARCANLTLYVAGRVGVRFWLFGCVCGRPMLNENRWKVLCPVTRGSKVQNVNTIYASVHICHRITKYYHTGINIIFKYSTFIIGYVKITLCCLVIE